MLSEYLEICGLWPTKTMLSSYDVDNSNWTPFVLLEYCTKTGEIGHATCINTAESKQGIQLVSDNDFGMYEMY